MAEEREGKRLRSPIVTVLGHVDHGKCLHPEEEVLLTGGSTVKIRELFDSHPTGRDGRYEWIDEMIGVMTPALGQVIDATATRVWRVAYNGPLYRVVTESGREVRVTPEHPFMTTRGWVRADSISIGERVYVVDKDYGLGTELVVRVSKENYSGYLYDLSVPPTHAFVANGIVVHNTTLLDKIRGTAVVAKEPGEMTQHVGASFVPLSVIEKVTKPLQKLFKIQLKIPGLLFIDTPGHEAFANLRRRGGSIADFAILVIDVMEGVKRQTEESIEILKERRVPFVVAANKIDRIYGWRSHPDTPFIISMREQSRRVLDELDRRIYTIVGQLAKFGIPAERYDRIRDFRKAIAIVPVSAKTGEGLPDLLAVLAGIIQKYLTKRIMFTEGPAKGVILEVKEVPGLGTAIDTIIYDGIIKRGDTIVLGGRHGPIVTRVRSLLMPKPLEEIRVSGTGFMAVEEVTAAAGVRISAPDLDDAVAGSPLYVVPEGEDPSKYAEEVRKEVGEVVFSKDIVGVLVKADTLGTLEAVVSMLERRGIPVRYADVGPLTRREVMEAALVAKNNRYYGVIILFNVKPLPEAEALARKEKVPIFSDRIIYRLIDKYLEWVEKEKRKDLLREMRETVFPGKFMILPGYVFRRSEPAIVGVRVLAGVIRPGYPVMRADGKRLGTIQQIQDRGESLDEAREGAEVAVSIRGHIIIGRHAKEGDVLYTDPSEADLERVVTKFAEFVTPDMLSLIREIVEIKRKHNKTFGVAVLYNLRRLEKKMQKQKK